MKDNIVIHKRNSDSFYVWASIVVLGIIFLSSFIKALSVLSGTNGQYIKFQLLVNFFIIVAALYKNLNEKLYSLIQMHWLFCFVFFLIAPMQQLTLNTWPWGITPGEIEIIKANNLVLIWEILIFFSQFFSKESLDIQELKINAYITSNNVGIAGLVLVLLALMPTIYLVKSNGVEALLFRGYSNNSLERASSLGILATTLSRGCIVAATAMAFKRVKNNGVVTVEALLIAFCFLLTCFPTGIARFKVGCFYIGLFLSLSGYFDNKKGKFFFYYIFALLIVFPAFNAFRRIYEFGSFDNMIELIAAQFENGYTDGNYDSYSIFFWTFRYISFEGLSFGSLLLTAALFFIPRSIWAGKSLDAGAKLFSYFGFTFTNIACSLPNYLYLDFGLLGIVVGGICIGRLMSQLDDRYWFKTGKPVLVSYYPFLLSLVIFNMRGSLLSTWSVTCGYLIGFYIVETVLSFIMERYKY